MIINTNLTDLKPNAWLGQIDEICDDLGFFEQLGTRHFAAFLGIGRKLLVTFENAQDVRAHNPDAEPRGFAYARHDGWSHLALLSEGESWFRDPAIYAFFDRLTDDGFFDDFERIVFHGTGSGGYAAAAFSVAAPGATVIALQPQATLDAQVTGWDKRFKAQRRINFRGRYGYAPDMIDAAEKVFVAYDPMQRLDAVHAMLFQNPNVSLLPCPFLGKALDQAFDRLSIHDVLLKLAMEGSLDQRRFAELLRARRYDPAYAQNLVTHLVKSGHHGLAKIICDYMLRRGHSTFFDKLRAELSEAA